MPRGRLLVALSAFALTLAAGHAAFAEDIVVVRGLPASGCTAKAAKPSEINKIAQSPQTFSGRCVRLKGYWRDIGFYPTAAEAAQPDAQSVVFLRERRVGLYLAEADAAHAPTGPRAATLVGTAGACADLYKGDGLRSVVGYCKYIPDGAFVAVVQMELAK